MTKKKEPNSIREVVAAQEYIVVNIFHERTQRIWENYT